MRTTLHRRHALLGALVAPLAVACRVEEPTPREPKLRENRDDRPVTRVLPARAVTDGAGVKIQRSIGAPPLRELDPFLLLDELHTDQADDYLAGFPDHPHRGFETVTYMLHGAMEHRDVLGNHGRLGPGATQWMTAGRGIIHSEMPRQERGLMWGFQLWVNLPARLKMTRPRYQDLGAERIPELASGDAQVRVAAGALRGVKGPVEGIVVAPLFLDITLPPGGALRERLPLEHTAFVYVTAGSVALGRDRREVRDAELATLGPGVHFSATSREGARLLLVAARPLGEPVARSGPFVMNTEAELTRAWQDFRAGRLLDG